MYFVKRVREKTKKRPKKKKEQIEKVFSFKDLPPKDIPKTKWTKADMQEWYDKYNITYDAEALKSELWDGIKKLLTNDS